MSEEKNKKLTLFGLVIPMMIENFMRQMVGIVNVFILGQHSDGAAAAVGVANQIINLVLMPCTLLAAGAASAISQYLGAKEHEKASRLASIVFGLFLFGGAFFSVIFAVFAEPLLLLMNLDASLLAQGKTYLQIVGGTVVLQILIAGLSGISRSYGNTKPAMTATLLMNILNVAGSYIVVFRPFETPFRDVSGVAIFVLFSQLLAAGYMVWCVCFRMHTGMKLQHLKGRILSELGIIFRYGFPSAMESLSFNIAQLLSTSFIGLLGASAVAARVYLLNIVNLSSMVGSSIGQGVQILVGRYIGAHEYENVKKLHRKAYWLMVPSNFAVSGLFALLGWPILEIFTSNPEIIMLAAPVLFIDIAVQVFRAIEHVSLYSLRGAGDVKFTMWFSISSAFIVNIGVGYLCSVVLGLGIIGIWIGFAADELMRAVFFTIHWYSEKWKKKSIV